MPFGEHQYLNILSELAFNAGQGEPRPDRTGTGTHAVFGRQMRFDLSDGLPLLTTKRLPFKSILVELLWMLRGDTNVKWLREHGCTIWDEWADANGDLGPVYGAQWRRWNAIDPDTGVGGLFETREIDQIANVIRSLRNDPFSRRHVVSAWNVSELGEMALSPCHCLFQFFVREVGEVKFLDCQLYQRSADIFLGVPFNIASYSLLTMILARHLDMEPGEFIWSGGDVHLYANHVDQAREQISRVPKPFFPFVEFDDVEDPFTLEPDGFTLVGYEPHPAIKAEVSV